MTTVRHLDRIDTSEIDGAKVDQQIVSDRDTAPDMADRLAEARIIRPPSEVDVKAVRTKLGLSQATFARRCGFNRRTLQD